MKSRSPRKAELAFEYMTQLTIIVVVLLVVVGMIITFRGEILQKWRDISNPGGNVPPVNTNAFFVEKIPPASFSASEFATYVEACWSDTRDSDESRVCFVLKGIAAPGVNAATIMPLIDSAIPPAKIKISANFGKDLFSINYEAIADEIHVKS